jgi:hypothetical protein
MGVAIVNRAKRDAGQPTLLRASLAALHYPGTHQR